MFGSCALVKLRPLVKLRAEDLCFSLHRVLFIVFLCLGKMKNKTSSKQQTNRALVAEGFILALPRWSLQH